MVACQASGARGCVCSGSLWWGPGSWCSSVEGTGQRGKGAGDRDRSSACRACRLHACLAQVGRAALPNAPGVAALAHRRTALRPAPLTARCRRLPDVPDSVGQPRLQPVAAAVGHSLVLVGVVGGNVKRIAAPSVSAAAGAAVWRQRSQVGRSGEAQDCWLRRQQGRWRWATPMPSTARSSRSCLQPGLQPGLSAVQDSRAGQPRRTAVQVSRARQPCRLAVQAGERWRRSPAQQQVL